MASKIISYRRDIITYKKFLKSELLRLTFNDGKFIIDKDNLNNKRGIYLYLPNFKVGKLIRAKSRISKAFKITLSEEQILKIEKEIEEWMKDKKL
ncbi:DUF448 domain-containing protein [Spiroplasma endosymbiont of Aspidapion aeneum]|uniref:DUF448 domain-containing protein n=1 Tax=Spiroplasma endosymbiont of Aspidapion aeneum TaxID=3066276 RepID=UPI00313F1629